VRVVRASSRKSSYRAGVGGAPSRRSRCGREFGPNTPPFLDADHRLTLVRAGAAADALERETGTVGPSSAFEVTLGPRDGFVAVLRRE